MTVTSTRASQVKPDHAAAHSSLGQTSVYKAIREGRLRIRKYGTRTIITRADLASFLENLPDETERTER